MLSFNPIGETINGGGGWLSHAYAFSINHFTFPVDRPFTYSFLIKSQSTDRYPYPDDRPESLVLKHLAPFHRLIPLDRPTNN